MTNKQMIILAGLGLIGLWYAKKKAGDALNAINPVNNNNIFYSGVNGIGGALSNDDNFSLGSWIYDLTNEDARFK